MRSRQERVQLFSNSSHRIEAETAMKAIKVCTTSKKDAGMDGAPALSCMAKLDRDACKVGATLRACLSPGTIGRFEPLFVHQVIGGRQWTGTVLKETGSSSRA